MRKGGDGDTLSGDVSCYRTVGGRGGIHHVPTPDRYYCRCNMRGCTSVMKALDSRAHMYIYIPGCSSPCSRRAPVQPPPATLPARRALRSTPQWSSSTIREDRLRLKKTARDQRGAAASPTVRVEKHRGFLKAIKYVRASCVCVCPCQGYTPVGRRVFLAWQSAAETERALFSTLLLFSSLVKGMILPSDVRRD